MSTNKFFSIKDIAEIAMLTALAVVLGTFCEIKIGANGGSIGFSMIPLFIISYRHGFIKGFIASGIIYGLIMCAIDGYGFLCYPLDYLLAYGSIGVAGIFARYIFANNQANNDLNGKESKFSAFIHQNKVLPYVFIVISILIACFLRLVFHVISGVVLWETEPWASFVYNVAYVGPSALLCMVTMCLLYEPLKRIEKMYPAKRWF